MKALKRFFNGALFLAIAAVLVTSTGFAGKKRPGDDYQDGAAPGEGVGSLPSVFTPPAGLMMIGSPDEILAVVERVSIPNGNGTMFSFEVNPGVQGGDIAVSFVGEVSVRMNRNALSGSSVRVFLSTGIALDGAQAQVAIGGSNLQPFQLEAQSFVELPLGAWFAPAPFDPPALSLQAVNTTGEAAADGPLWYGALARSHGNTLLVGQRANF